MHSNGWRISWGTSRRRGSRLAYPTSSRATGVSSEGALPRGGTHACHHRCSRCTETPNARKPFAHRSSPPIRRSRGNPAATRRVARGVALGCAGSGSVINLAEPPSHDAPTTNAGNRDVLSRVACDPQAQRRSGHDQRAKAPTQLRVGGAPQTLSTRDRWTGWLDLEAAIGNGGHFRRLGATGALLGGDARNLPAAA